MLKGIEKHGFGSLPSSMPRRPARLRVVGGQQPAAHVTADGKHVLVGGLFDAKAMIAAGRLKLVASPMSARMWSKLEASAGVPDGRADAPRVVYLQRCQLPLLPQILGGGASVGGSGKVQLRHIMVGVIREEQSGQSGSDPLRA